MYWTSRGIWFKLVRNVKRMRSSLTEEVRSIAMVKTAVAWGALTRKITIRVEGEYVEGPLLTLFLRQSSLSFTSSTSPLLASSTPTNAPVVPAQPSHSSSTPLPLSRHLPLHCLPSSFGVVHAYPLVAGCPTTTTSFASAPSAIEPPWFCGVCPPEPLARIVSVACSHWRQCGAGALPLLESPQVRMAMTVERYVVSLSCVHRDREAGGCAHRTTLSRVPHCFGGFRHSPRLLMVLAVLGLVWG
ncbi:hypothetical protein DFP72DRAFT_184039 [Ephemerocybe angulata]|uniref:Uncharacterized protein n=1 Tax=Ephemerocybe angulata TaxID=980116 RepID=A0A8H6LU69_9AGAR|nr:hypothetical protein DFP72DRAFT_184039 [Tulosesus angulatus]